MTGQKKKPKTISQPEVDIIIPTLDNWQLLSQCLLSMLTHTTDVRFRILIVNNGLVGSIERMVLYNEDIQHWMGKPGAPEVFVLEDEQQVNRGWEGGLVAGLEQSSSPYVLFANDDIHIVGNDTRWLRKMVDSFKDRKVAAVGPSSNVVMGHQQIFHTSGEPGAFRVWLLIGFCMLVRRKALDEIGGVALGLSGGDDLDLCLRFANNEWKMIMRNDVFVYHHGFKTGKRIHGEYWNSTTMADLTRMEMVRRNGLRAYCRMFNTSPERVK